MADQPRARPPRHRRSCTRPATRTTSSRSAVRLASSTEGRRRAHQRPHQEVHRSGRVSVPPARRAADQVRDRAGSRPAPEAGLGTAPATHVRRAAPSAGRHGWRASPRAWLTRPRSCAGARRARARPGRIGRGAVQPPAVAQQAAPDTPTSDEDRPEEAARARSRARWPCRSRTCPTPPPASWSIRRCSALRRAASSAFCCAGEAGSFGRSASSGAQLLLGAGAVGGLDPLCTARRRSAGRRRSARGSPAPRARAARRRRADQASATGPPDPPHPPNHTLNRRKRLTGAAHERMRAWAPMPPPPAPTPHGPPSA